MAESVVLRRATKLFGLLELIAVAAMGAAFAAFCSEHKLPAQLLNYGSSQVYVLNPGEARFYLMGLLLGIPSALLLADAAMRWLPGRSCSLIDRAVRFPRASLGALCCGAVAACEAVGCLFGHAQFTDDERIYLWQAGNFLRGSFTGLRPVPSEFFHSTFVFMLPVEGGRWGATYPPGGPGLIALGTLLGAPHLPQLLCVGLIVWMAARFAQEVWGAKEGVFVAALVASSPMLIMSGATLHNSIPTALCSIAALRFAFAAYQHQRARDVIFSALWIGGALICRPADAVILAVPCAVLIVPATFRRSAQGHGIRRKAATLLIAVGCGLPFIMLLLASQKAVTGSYFIAPFTRMNELWPGSHVFGFGLGAFGVDHTLALALSKFLVIIARVNGWVFGWPLALLPALIVLVGLGRDRVSVALLSFIGLHLVVYFFYVAPSVHTFGSCYELPLVPALAMLTARLVSVVGAALARFGDRFATIPGRALGALAVVALVFFWPCQLRWLAATAGVINAPLEAAAEQAKQGPIVVFQRGMQPPSAGRATSWVFWPPFARSDFSDPVIWAADLGLHNLELLKLMPSRRPMLLTWDGLQARVVQWTPELAPPGSDKAPVDTKPGADTNAQPSQLIVSEGLSTRAARSLGTDLLRPSPPAAGSSVPRPSRPMVVPFQ